MYEDQYSREFISEYWGLQFKGLSILQNMPVGS